MLNTKLKTTIFILALFATPAMGASALGAGEHALFQIFFNEGSKPFPETVKGKHIEEKMHNQGFDIMLSAQSAGLHNGDVWSLQSNTLRHLDDELVDFGVGCSLVMKIDPVKAGGLCNVFMGQHDGKNVKSMHIIKSIVLESEMTWYKVFDDKGHGVAGYMTHESSDLFHQ